MVCLGWVLCPAGHGMYAPEKRKTPKSPCHPGGPGRQRLYAALNRPENATFAVFFQAFFTACAAGCAQAADKRIASPPVWVYAAPYVDEKLFFLPGALCPASGHGGLVRGPAGVFPDFFCRVRRPAGCRCPAARLYRPALGRDGGQARGGQEHWHVRCRGACPALQPRPGGAGSREPFLRRRAKIRARCLRAASGGELFRHQDREQARSFRHHGHQEPQDGRLQLGRRSDPAHLPGLPPALHLPEGRPAGRQRQGLAAQGRAGHDRAGADGVPGIPESR